MSRLLLFGFLITASIAFAQFNLEHEYTPNQVRRLNLEYSGEKYAEIDAANHIINFYNSDHTFWKSITLDVPSGANFMYCNHISEALIDPDANIELDYRYSIGQNPVTYYSKIISENGSELLSMVNAGFLEFNTYPGLTPKLIVQKLNDSRVLSLPGLQLEHIYTEGYPTRVNLDVSGEKYFTRIYSNSTLTIYNSDHSVWKTMNTGAPPNTFPTNITALSEGVINGDPLLEFSSSYMVGQNYISKLINENGDVLLTVNNASSINISAVEGGDIKLMAYMYNEPNAAVKIFSLPDFAVQHSYPEFVKRIKLEVSGEKYYTVNKNPLEIYNSDHTLWKSIELVSNDPIYYQYNISHISEITLVDDLLLEVMYINSENLLMEQTNYNGFVINENGLVYLNIPAGMSLGLSQFPGLENKLIAIMGINNSETGPVIFGTRVYGIDSSMGFEGFDINSNIIYPNPCSTALHISSGERIAEISFYNMRGSLVKMVYNPASTPTNVEDLPIGLYVIRIKDRDGKSSSHKLLISR